MNADFRICVHFLTNMEIAKDITNNFYPDLVEKGGLDSALQSAFTEIQSSLKVTNFGTDFLFVCSYVEKNNRSSQIKIASEQRLFIGDFWESGIILGKTYTDSISELVQVIHEWLETSISITELGKKFEFVELHEKAEYFETGREVEWQWKNLHNWIPKYMPELVPILNEASKNSILSKLFPFTSHYDFRFSRCTGSPFTEDCPYAFPLENGQYKVNSYKGKYLGEGDAKEAVELIIKNLPPNTDFAIRGTKDDL